MEEPKGWITQPRYQAENKGQETPKKKKKGQETLGKNRRYKKIMELEAWHLSCKHKVLSSNLIYIHTQNPEHNGVQRWKNNQINTSS
jgi:hypothetical protein